MNKFKVGDRVRSVFGESYDLYYGKMGTVTRVTLDQYFTEMDIDGEEIQWSLDTSLELVESSEEPPYCKAHRVAYQQPECPQCVREAVAPPPAEALYNEEYRQEPPVRENYEIAPMGTRMQRMVPVPKKRTHRADGMPVSDTKKRTMFWRDERVPVWHSGDALAYDNLLRLSCLDEPECYECNKLYGNRPCFECNARAIRGRAAWLKRAAEVL